MKLEELPLAEQALLFVQASSAEDIGVSPSTRNIYEILRVAQLARQTYPDYKIKVFCIPMWDQGKVIDHK